MGRRPPKPRDDQQNTALALSRESRLELLARVDYARAGLTRRQWELVRRLCEAVEVSTDRMGRASVATLAAKCRCSERTAYRAVDCGRRAGVILTSPTYDDQGRSANEWRVAWDRLAILAGWTSSGDCQLSSATGPVPAKKVAGTGSHRGKVAGTDLVFNYLIQNPPPILEQGSYQEASGVPNRSDGGRREDFFDFDFLIAELYEAGVDQASEAIRIAREQGLGADQVAAIVEHWRSHGGGLECAAWGPGALCWRLKNARPQLPADRGWPQPAKAFEQHRASEARRAAELRDARARHEREQERAAIAAESAGGPSILEMYRAELRSTRRGL